MSDNELNPQLNKEPEMTAPETEAPITDDVAANTEAPATEKQESTPTPPANPVWAFPLSVLPTGPYQEHILKSMDSHNRILVEGAPGSGKTYTMTAIALKALMGNGSTLIIADDHSLRESQKLINHAGLSDFCLVFTDEESGKQALIDALRAVPEHVRKRPSFDDDHFKKVYRTARKALKRIEEAQEALYQPISEGRNWREITSLYLENQAEQSKQLLMNRQNPKDFEWTTAEYEYLRTALVENEELIKPIGTLHHALNALNDNLFQNNTVEEAEMTAETTLKRLLDRLTGLSHRMTMMLEDYAEALRLHYTEYTRDFRNKSRQLRQDIVEYTRDYGKDFDENGTLKDARLRFMGIFSKKHRDLRDVKSEIFERFQTLQDEFKAKRYVEHVFSPIKGGVTFAKVNNSLQEFEASLNEWEKRIPVLVREEAKRLNPQTIHFEQTFRQRLENLEVDLAEFIKNINESGLFVSRFRTDAQMLAQKRDWVEKQLEDIYTVHYAMRDFRAYYPWRKHWQSLTPKASKLVETLMAVKPFDWQRAFESWYWHQFLQQKHSPIMPDEDFDGIAQVNAIHETRELLPAKMVDEGRVRQGRGLANCKRANSGLFKAMFSKKNHKYLEPKALEEILDLGLNTIVECFPIILVNLDFAEKHLSGKNAFDAVLLDDSGANGEHIKNLYSMGRTVVAFTRPGSKLPLDGYVQVELEQIYDAEKGVTKSKSSASSLDHNFNIQAARRLGQFIDASRIETDKTIEGITVDIVVKPEHPGAKPSLVICDGVLRDRVPDSAEMTYFQINRLKEKGYPVFMTSSVEWWRSDDRAARRLAASILHGNK